MLMIVLKGGEIIYKLLLIPLLLVIWMNFYINGLNQQLAMSTYYKGKQAVNRGAHAGALQLDQALLAEGIFQIDERKARSVVEQYLFSNLNLSSSGQPTENSFIRDQVNIIYYEVLNSSLTYPYHYSLPQYEFSTIFERPAVIVVIELSSPSIFSNGIPVKWNIIGSAQIILPY